MIVFNLKLCACSFVTEFVNFYYQELTYVKPHLFQHWLQHWLQLFIYWLPKWVNFFDKIYSQPNPSFSCLFISVLTLLFCILLEKGNHQSISTKREREFTGFNLHEAVCVSRVKRWVISKEKHLTFDISILQRYK